MTQEADGFAIAQRSACRVFPLFAQVIEAQWAIERFLTPLPSLRALLAVGVASKFQTPELSRSAFLASEAAYDPAQPINSAACADQRNAHSSTDAVAAAYADAAYNVVHAALGAAYAAADAAADMSTLRGPDTAGGTAHNIAHAAVWDQIDSDIQRLTRGEDLLSAPLWSGLPPHAFGKADTKSRAIWAKDPPETWDFWTRWWDGVLSGQQIDWQVQKAVALIADAVWKAGPNDVADAIREIEARFALDLTDNAETVAPNPETGKLRLVPAMPADLTIYIRRKIQRAIDIFPEGEANQYRALANDRHMLQQAIDAAADLPIELFDACASALRRLGIRVKNGECPSEDHDPLIADYAAQLRDTATDILGHDTMTQDVLDRRTRLRGSDLLQANRDIVLAAVDQLRPITEGRLNAALSSDAQVATSANADPEERKASTFRLAGRVLRVVKWTCGAALAGGGAIIYSAEMVEAYASLNSHPAVRAMIDLIMKALGLG